MTKQTALGDAFFVGANDFSGDIGALQAIKASRALIDISGIDKSGYERLLGRADGQITFAGFYNPSAGQSHAVLSTIGTAAGTANTIATYAHGTAQGNDAASLWAALVQYDVSVASNLAIALTSDAQAAKGSPLEWGVMLTTGKQTFASSGTTAAYDNGAAHSFGGAGYLHSFSIASGTATVAIQHSTTGTASWSDVISFTATSAAGFERKATAAITTTVNEFLRVNVTGTFTNLVCFVNAVIYPTSQT